MKRSIAHRLVIVPGLAIAALTCGTVMQAYVTNGYKWGTTVVNYYVNPQNKWVSESAAVSALQTAAATWHDQTRANVQLAYAGYTSGASLGLNYKSEVFFRGSTGSGAGAATYFWTDSSGKIVDSDMVVYEDAYKFFAFSGCDGGIYIEALAVHEFGHFLGLYHSEVPGAVMQPYMSSYCDRSYLQLTPDDIAGIESLYAGGSGPANTAPSVSIGTPSNNATYSGDATISFSGSATDAQDGNLTSNLRWTSNLAGQIGNGGSFARKLSVGSHVITVAATDSGALTGSQQFTVVVASSVAPPSPTPVPSGASLSARGYKVKGLQKVDLTWSGLAASTVELYRNDSLIGTTANSGSATDALNKKGSGLYRYKVCEAGASICSNTVSVTF